jgi:hypothetical protein
MAIPKEVLHTMVNMSVIYSSILSDT